MKLTKEQKEDIKQVKSHISNLQKLQETSYDLMINRLGIENGDALWDYCFNNFGNLKQIEKAAKRKAAPQKRKPTILELFSSHPKKYIEIN